MRILFTRFPLESALGGAEIQTLSLMEGLMERGHAVAFAGSCPVLLAECRKRNIPVAEVQIGPPPVTKVGAISFTWRKAKMRARLKAMFDSFENKKTRDMSDEAHAGLKSQDSHLDAIVMLSLSEKLLLTDIAANAGTKVVWIEHDRIGRWLTQNPWLSLLKKQSEKATTIVVSELSKKMYVELGWSTERSVAIPNGVALATSHKPLASTSRELEAGGSYRLGCISRLSREKGIDVLIEALATVPDVTLEIVGTGREEAALKALARRLSVDNRVTFTHHIPDISDAYARFDALVLPSRDHDPFGMVAAEAMLAGLPVIVTDQCGIAGYMEDGKDALIVKADSASALADAIKRYQISDVRSQLAEQGRKTAEKKFTVERMVEEYEKIFTQKNR